MKKIRLVIADSNQDYLESLGAYIRTTDDNNSFIVSYFSNMEGLQAYLNQGEIMDVLLISPEMYSQNLMILNDTVVILLEDDVLSISSESNATVYRYQRLDQLIANVLGIYYEKNEDAGRLLERSNQTEIISVFSPNGGTGKTTVAANLSKQLALNGKKVFYLNLETFNTTKLFFTDEKDDASLQIFYYVKTGSSQLLSKIETLKKHDPYSMVDYFEIDINAEEMMELTKEDTKRLINGLVETGTYDYIIIDLDGSLHERNITAINESDSIFWVLANDHLGVLKTTSLLGEEEKIFGKENVVKDKMLVILNKYYGNVSGDFGSNDLSIDGYLPFIPNWMEHQSKREVLSNDKFNQELQSIIHRLLLKEREGVYNG